MITRAEQESARKRAVELLQRAGIVARQDELEQIEVADFGLGELEQSGVQILTLVDTEKIAAKVLVLFPYQTQPEHTHSPLGDYPGKESPSTPIHPWVIIRARRRPCAANGANFTFMCQANQPRSQSLLHQRTAGTRTPCGTNTYCVPVIRSLCNRIYPIGSKVDQRVLWSGPSRRKPLMLRTYLLIQTCAVRQWLWIRLQIMKMLRRPGARHLQRSFFTRSSVTNDLPMHE